MLASLLPGLRDVRTPLTVGYLWLVIAWVLFGNDWPKSRPEGNGLVPRLFELETALGRGAFVAGLSFTAYLVGALLSISLEGRVGTRVLEAVTPILRHNRRREDEFMHILEGLEGQLKEVRRVAGLSRAGAIRGELMRSTSAEALRIRLLVASQSLYGEYDRLAAEAGFRVNVTLPLMALSWIIASEAGVIWGIVGTVASCALAIQGLRRGIEANEILHRAVIAGVIVLPAAAEIRQALVSSA